MTFFSRCDTSQHFASSSRVSAPKRARHPSAAAGAWAALAGFAEDISILVRYAAGLDYYRRDASRSGQ